MLLLFDKDTQPQYHVDIFSYIYSVNPYGWHILQTLCATNTALLKIVISFCVSRMTGRFGKNPINC